mmetsp:Transcript_8558/g.25452  ORF Transcript_8558/g.25452 Transcript_8558/m.25452 type:complete len:289 (+) Transcript_8558:100-966(+)
MTKFAARCRSRLLATPGSAVSASARACLSSAVPFMSAHRTTLLATRCCTSLTASSHKTSTRAARCAALPCSSTRCRTKLPKLLRHRANASAVNSPTTPSSSSGGKCSSKRSSIRERMACFAASAARPRNSWATKRSCRGGSTTTHCCNTKLACGEQDASHTWPWNCWATVSLSSSWATSMASCKVLHPCSSFARLRALWTNHRSMEGCSPMRTSNESSVARCVSLPSMSKLKRVRTSPEKGTPTGNIGQNAWSWLPETHRCKTPAVSPSISNLWTWHRRFGTLTLSIS